MENVFEDVVNNKSSFFVENGFNTCYMSSLLMALFYKTSCIDFMLGNDPQNLNFVYFQEIVKNHFVEIVRNGNSVTGSTMNELRNFANMCGWLEFDEILEQQDVNEFFSFLLIINVFTEDNLLYLSLNSFLLFIIEVLICFRLLLLIF